MSKEQQEAERLIELFFGLSGQEHWQDHTDKTQAKACAAICVRKIIDLDVWGWPHNAEKGQIYWMEVLEQINKP